MSVEANAWYCKPQLTYIKRRSWAFGKESKAKIHWCNDNVLYKQNNKKVLWSKIGTYTAMPVLHDFVYPCWNTTSNWKNGNYQIYS